MLLYFLILFGIYFLVVMMVLAGWMVAIQLKPVIHSEDRALTLIVPFRNEEDNLPQLLDSLVNLNYPFDKFEIIFVNDHSTDSSLMLLERWKQKQTLTCTIISLTDEYGKKQALQAGISAANNDWIVTTDADCIVPTDWLTRMTKAIQSHHQLLFGLVSIQAKGFWSRLQQTEFFSVIGITLSAWGWGRPIMCNGANLVFRKSAFREVGGYDGNLHLSSGDDEFLLRKIIRTYGSNSVGFHPANVITQPQPDVKNFLQQRIRWASKWGASSSQLSGGLALLVLMVQLSWWPLLGLYFWGDEALLSFVIAVKILIEFWILYSVSVTLGTRFHLLSFLALQFLYAPYVVCVALLSQVNAAHWKGRPIFRPVN